jgi:formylglycine-generating enzyme required for sulfatase activity
MILIPAGTFFMGTTGQPEARYEDEWPGREVALDAFQIDRYEVTTRQYAQFLEWLAKQKDSTRHKHCYKLEPAGKDHTPLGCRDHLHPRGRRDHLHPSGHPDHLHPLGHRDHRRP